LMAAVQKGAAKRGRAGFLVEAATR